MGSGRPAHPTIFVFLGAGPAAAFADDNIVGWTSSGTTTFRTRSRPVANRQVPRTDTFNSHPMIGGTTPEPTSTARSTRQHLQIVSTTVLAGVTYTLDVDLGFEQDGARSASVYLIVDGQSGRSSDPTGVLRSDPDADAGHGNWYDFQASYTATGADADDPITIVLSSHYRQHDAGSGYFGDVRLDGLIARFGSRPRRSPRLGR